MPQAKTKETFKSPKHMKRSYQTHNKVLPFTPNNIIANFSWGSEYSKVWTRKFNLTRKTVAIETPQMPYVTFDLKHHYLTEELRWKLYMVIIDKITYK